MDRCSLHIVHYFLFPEETFKIRKVYTRLYIMCIQIAWTNIKCWLTCTLNKFYGLWCMKFTPKVYPILSIHSVEVKPLSDCVMSFSVAQQPNAGQGRLILEVSVSHAMTHHSRLDLSDKDWPVAKNSAWQDNAQKRQTSMLLIGIKPAIPAGCRSENLVFDRSDTGLSSCRVYASYIGVSLCL